MADKSSSRARTWHVFATRQSSATKHDPRLDEWYHTSHCSQDGNRHRTTYGDGAGIARHIRLTAAATTSSQQCSPQASSSRLQPNRSLQQLCFARRRSRASTSAEAASSAGTEATAGSETTSAATETTSAGTKTTSTAGTGAYGAGTNADAPGDSTTNASAGFARYQRR